MPKIWTKLLTPRDYSVHHLQQYALRGKAMIRDGLPIPVQVRRSSVEDLQCQSDDTFNVSPAAAAGER